MDLGDSAGEGRWGFRFLICFFCNLLEAGICSFLAAFAKVGALGAFGSLGCFGGAWGGLFVLVVGQVVIELSV